MMDFTRLSVRRAALALSLTLACFLSASMARADRLFLFADDTRPIVGDSKDSRHANWINVDSYGWGQKSEGDGRGGGGGFSPKPVFMDFRIVKRIDRSSPAFAALSVNGRHLPRVILEVCRETPDGSRCYYRVTLNDVTVSGYQVAGTAKGSTEELSLRFAKIRCETFSQDEAGRWVPGVPFGWDRQRNAPLSFRRPAPTSIIVVGDRRRIDPA
jgi:type VI secretion system secreted protein Hcp